MKEQNSRPGSSHRVGVIVPAFNAAGTLDATLRSIRGQTYGDLDIIVVNDGSTDATLAMAQAHARADRRIRVVSQDNAGVAAARNRGVRETSAALLAPVDADDLWHSEKIALQIERLDEAGRTTELVYTWSATIDRDSRIAGLDNRATDEGDVLSLLARGNFLGNASCALFRREAFEQAGGYDPSLHAAGAQGCEDWQLYLGIAQRGRFAVVPRDLTGYRVLSGNMSSNALTMWRSHQIVAARLLETHPELASDVRAGEEKALAWLISRSAAAGDFKAAMALAGELRRRNSRRAAESLLSLPITVLRSLVSPALKRGIKTAFRGSQDPDDPIRPGALFPVGTCSEETAGDRSDAKAAGQSPG